MQCLYICLYKYARWWFQRVYTFTPARRNFACNYILIFSIGFKPAISVFDLTTRKRHYFCVVCSFLHSRPPTKSRSNPALILLAGLHDVFIVMSLTLSLFIYLSKYTCIHRTWFLCPSYNHQWLHDAFNSRFSGSSSMDNVTLPEKQAAKAPEKNAWKTFSFSFWVLFVTLQRRNFFNFRDVKSCSWLWWS